MSDASTLRRGPFQAGDLILLIDPRERRYLVRLSEGETLHTHMGYIRHSQVIGLQEGAWVSTSGGHPLLALRPLLADVVLNMPRATQVVYPKDLGAILIYADIFPGAKVVEAGLGSGALAMTLLRAVGQQGCVVSYEIHPSAIERAVQNIHAVMPATPNLMVKLADVYHGVEERQVDRIVLDLPEPWQVIPSALEALVPGGLLLALIPTALQVHQLVNSLRYTGRFHLVETIEVLTRSWHVTERSLRPDHRMIGHTGFLVRARKAEARPGPPSDGDINDSEISTDSDL